MRPLVRSYGVISTRTLSPASTRMRFLRMRPAVWAMISCSFSSLTRNVAFGSSSVTTPGNSSNSSFAIDIRVRVRRSPLGSRALWVLGIREWARKLAETPGFHNTPAPPRKGWSSPDGAAAERARNPGPFIPHSAALHAGYGHSSSLVAARAPGEPRLDACHELIAHVAIGVELLFAAAGGDGRIRGRPILHLDRQRAGELERLVMGFRRERHDHVEIEPLPFLELLERGRPVPVDVEPDLVHDRDREGVELALAHAGRADVSAAAEQLPEQRRRHRRADRVQAAGEQHRMGLERAPCRGHPAYPFQCRTQTRVNSRRAVSKSISIFSLRRSLSSSEPSLCSPRRPMSIASI